MKASELIRCLHVQIEEYGDLEVMDDNGFVEDVVWKEENPIGSICCCSPVVNGLCTSCFEHSEEFPTEYFYIEVI